ncbi:very short patch repair endonuclease [Chryseobacterium lactis]|uniref:Very short patch repair endonuclease n=1 Tax=Chryseobacterium lactis TaxID=1241981 RepID=A0A3G6RES8_CHRLC|nr:very short patch repair endonuclease [Chryseobacterium lactis]AZA82227.1 very short patch repair endonuclease [Chryseobacterium lactis]AZB02608.1 very short patch repair endonuclease [Chryseobacterium lactis]PNW14098.1 very short patch repair endonuclease [Chryseobacterium lactis]
MDNLTPEQRRKNMQAIKSKETKEEVLLAKALWNLGYRYRKNNKKILGKPDISFSKYKIAIFVDGEFFHGKDWETQKNRIKTNRDYWIPKIERNIQRDKEVTEYLLSNNWRVIRFWSKEVKKNLSSCLEIIQQEISKLKKN